MKKIIDDRGNFVDEMGRRPARWRTGTSFGPPSEDRRALRAHGGAGHRGQGGHRDRRRLRAPAVLPRLRRGRGLGLGRRRRERLLVPLARADLRRHAGGADDGAGVLYLYGNYGGDVYNFDIAADLAAGDDVDAPPPWSARTTSSPPPPIGRTPAAASPGSSSRTRPPAPPPTAGTTSDGRHGDRAADGRAHAHHGSRALADDPARRRRADVHPGRGGDGDRYRDPRRTG